MPTKYRIVSSLFFFTSVVSFAEGPSFNCNKATTGVEKTICSSKELSKFDRQLSSTYLKIKKSTPTPPLLKAAQIRWVVDGRGCIASADTKENTSCLVKHYRERINSLNALVESQEKINTNKKLLRSQTKQLSNINQLKQLNSSPVWQHFVNSYAMSYYQGQAQCVNKKRGDKEKFSSCADKLYSSDTESALNVNQINATLENYTFLNKSVRSLPTYLSDGPSVAKYVDTVEKTYKKLGQSFITAIEKAYPGCDKSSEKKLSKQLKALHQASLQFYSDFNFYVYRDNNPNIWGAIDVVERNNESHQLMIKQLITVFNLVKGKSCGPSL